MRQLVQSAGWAALVEIAKAQVATRQGAVGQPLKKLDDVYEQEFRKGEIVGMQTLIAIPTTLLESSKDILEDAERRGVDANGVQLGDFDET